MSARPDVTVVIATRNRREWLERCVGSVVSQSGPAFETIVVDDASTDGTGDWLKTVTGGRLTAIHLATPSERSTARNRGLDAARGEFVMFLDDDDSLHPGALETLASALARRPDAVAAVGARRACFTAENYERRDAHPRLPEVRYIADELMIGWSAVSGQNLYRTDLVRHVGGYDPALRVCEDRDLWFRLGRLGPIALCPETVVTYRMHPQQSRPANVRRIREQVAGRAIRRLPKRKRRHALRLRRTTALIDRAEDDFSAGRVRSGVAAALRAVANTPTIFLSPLVAGWMARRLAGRLARRFIWPVRLPQPTESR